MSNIKSQLDENDFLPSHDHDKANDAPARLSILGGKVFNRFICASDFHRAVSLTDQIALSKMRLHFKGV
jgi:hypothetical protein